MRARPRVSEEGEFGSPIAFWRGCGGTRDGGRSAPPPTSISPLHGDRRQGRHGPLEPFIFYPWIEDISCSGLGPVYTSTRIFAPSRARQLETHEELDDFVSSREKMKKPVIPQPLVDATLHDARVSTSLRRTSRRTSNSRSGSHGPAAQHRRISPRAMTCRWPATCLSSSKKA